MTSRRYEDIIRCLHVTDNSMPIVAGNDVEFDQLRKMRWLISELQGNCRQNDDPLQRKILSYQIVPPQEIDKMGSEGLVFGGCAP